MSSNGRKLKTFCKDHETPTPASSRGFCFWRFASSRLRRFYLLAIRVSSERVWMLKRLRQSLRTDRFQSTQVHSCYGRREPSPAAPRLGLLAFVLKPQEGNEPTRSGYA